MNRLVRWVGPLLSLAMLVGLTVAERPVHADATGTPPNIVDYNQVPVEYQPAVLAFARLWLLVAWALSVSFAPDIATYSRRSMI